METSPGQATSNELKVESDMTHFEIDIVEAASWLQSDGDIHLRFPIPERSEKNQIIVKIKKKKLFVAIQNSPVSIRFKVSFFFPFHYK